jgi:hypothetical protein
MQSYKEVVTGKAHLYALSKRFSNKTKFAVIKMNPNTQLPAEWKSQIENEAEYRASLQFHKKYSNDQWQACVITYRQGATAYATKAYQAQQENEMLKKQALDMSMSWYSLHCWQMKARDIIESLYDRFIGAAEMAGDDTDHKLLKKATVLFEDFGGIKAKTEYDALQQEIEELKRWKEEAKNLLEKVKHRHEGGYSHIRWLGETKPTGICKRRLLAIRMGI